MNLKVDGNLSVYPKPALAGEGYEVSTAEEVGLLGRCDTEVACAAKCEGRVLFALDLEFAHLLEVPARKSRRCRAFPAQEQGKALGERIRVTVRKGIGSWNLLRMCRSSGSATDSGAQAGPGPRRAQPVGGRFPALVLLCMHIRPFTPRRFRTSHFRFVLLFPSESSIMQRRRDHA